MQPISVTIADPKRQDQIVQFLRAAGMQIDGNLRSIGVVTGRVPFAAIATLRAIEGVGNVEAQRSDIETQGS